MLSSIFVAGTKIISGYNFGALLMDLQTVGVTEMETVEVYFCMLGKKYLQSY